MRRWATVVVVALTGALLFGVAGAQDVVWSRQFGTPGSDVVTAIEIDSNGDLYVAGYTAGALPGQTWAGGRDAFVRRYDAAGTEIWTRQFGTAAGDQASGLILDGSRLYVVGSTAGALPGQVAAGGTDAFVRRFDTNGNETWTRQFGTSSADTLADVAVDGSGNVSIAGQTGGALPGLVSAGGADAFVRCYLPSGVTAWTRQFGTAGADAAVSLVADASGNVTAAGSVAGALPGQGSAGGTDAFLRRFNANGAEIWTRQFGTPAADGAVAIAADAGGTLLIAGSAGGALPGQTSAGGTDAFVRSYSSAGSEAWTRQFGSDAADAARAVDADSTGIVYVAGTTDGALPGEESAGSTDAFVRRFGADGSPSWTHQFGTAAADGALGAGAGAAQSVFVGGGTAGGLPGHTSAGADDGFVLRLGQPTCVDTAAPDAREDGPISGPLHAAEPWVPNADLREQIHQTNCTVVFPLEQEYLGA